MRHTPLLILLLFSLWHMDAAARETNIEASAINHEVVASNVSGKNNLGETSFGGPALEPGSTIAGPFDLSYLLILALGIPALAWMRRQARSL